jgi:hypothetical protein
MCRQKLRNEVPEAGKPALSCNQSPSWVSVRILHAYRIFCSRSSSGSLVLLLHWRLSDGASTFLGKGRQPALIEPCCGLVSKRAGSGALLPEARSFDNKFDAVSAPSAEQRICASVLTPQEADRRSNRRRFTDQQKRAIVHGVLGLTQFDCETIVRSMIERTTELGADIKRCQLGPYPSEQT